MRLLDKFKAAVSGDQTGTYVSRPVLNGDKWEAWAKAVGIPSPVPGAEMHVTVLYSRLPVKTVPARDTMQIFTATGQFCMMGLDESVLAFQWCDWCLSDRNYFFMSCGALSDWPIYKPHMSLSFAAGQFDLTPEQMATAPLSIILGPEVFAPLSTTNPADAPDADDETEGVTEIEASAASRMLQKGMLAGDMSPEHQAILREISVHKRVMRSDLADVAKSAHVETEIAEKAVKGEYGAPAKAGYADPGYQQDKKPRYPLKVAGKFNEGHIRSAWSYINVAANQTPYTHAQVGEMKDKIVAAWKEVIDPAGPPSAAVSKGADDGEEVRIVLKAFSSEDGEWFKAKAAAGAERQVFYGWGSKSTIKGAEYRDLEGDAITTAALHDFTHKIMKGGRASTFEHRGLFCNDIVEAWVFDHESQKSLGIDLGFEGAAFGIHIPDPQNWEKVKSGEWELSIAGTAYIEQIED